MTTLYYLLLLKHVREKDYKTQEFIGDEDFIPELLDSQFENNSQIQNEAIMMEREKQMVEEARRKEIEELKRFKESLNLPVPVAGKSDQRRAGTGAGTEPSVPTKSHAEAPPKTNPQP